jgi:hypothetical protein
VRLAFGGVDVRALIFTTKDAKDAKEKRRKHNSIHAWLRWT